MTAAIWLDITGVRRGTDAAILAQRLGTALRAQLGAQVRLCDRRPGLTERPWSDLTTALTAQPTHPRRGGAAGRRRPIDSLAARLPPAVRAALRRAARLQLETLRAVRLSPPSLPAPTSDNIVDTAPIAPGDILLMLMPSGDVSRLHAAGLRIACLLADTLFLTRPDWLTPEAAEEAAVWQATTVKLAEHVLACTDEVPHDTIEAAGEALPPPAGKPPPFPPGFVLADGEIGIPGHTRHLLLVWRLLLDEMAPGTVPKLILAGHIGHLATDVLAQLRNSDGLGGHVAVMADPTPGDRAALYEACRFTLALEPHSAWERATLDSLAAGRPCLSVFPAEGACPVRPDNVTHLAAAVRAWIATPPPRPVAPTRSWNDVASDLLKVLAP